MKGDPMTEVEVVNGGEPPEPQAGNRVSQPGKLMRIALMLRELQEEVRRAAPDEPGRERLRTVHDRAIQELCAALSPELREELSGLTFSFDEGTPTESEIRIAQAQLLGWLEGLFQGIQAAVLNQQLQARQQLDQMRRGLPPGSPRPGPPQELPPQGTGHYL
jgi:hypothetical protein